MAKKSTPDSIPASSSSDPRAGRTHLRRIGEHTLSPATLMMGYGYDPALSEGALKPPVFLTSTYVFENAAAGKRHFEAVTGQRPGGSDGLIYGRFNGPDQEILEDRLAIWENSEAALAFSSGMSAISTVLMALTQADDIIVHSAPLYAATETLIGRVMGRFGVKWLDFPAGGNAAQIETALMKARSMGNTGLIYLESPANPTNMLVDIEAVARARDEVFEDSETKPAIVVDNTFLGPLWQQPLAHGADIVVYSLTKYMGGHSDLVAGGVMGRKQALTPIRAVRNTLGTIIDPHTAWMLLRSLETLELRMTRAGENAAKICAFLKDHPKVEQLSYLGHLKEGSAQHDIFHRHCTGAGSTFSLYLKGGEAEAFRFLDALRIAKLAVSLGGTETLASHPAGMTHLSVPAARKKELGISDNLVRISIGIENAQDLLADFAQALERV